MLLLPLFPAPVPALLEEDASMLSLPSETQAINDPEGIQQEPGLLQESIKSLTSKATPFDTCCLTARIGGTATFTTRLATGPPTGGCEVRGTSELGSLLRGSISSLPGFWALGFSDVFRVQGFRFRGFGF